MPVASRGVLACNQSEVLKKSDGSEWNVLEVGWKLYSRREKEERGER